MPTSRHSSYTWTNHPHTLRICEIRNLRRKNISLGFSDRIAIILLLSIRKCNTFHRMSLDFVNVTKWLNAQVSSMCFAVNIPRSYFRLLASLPTKIFKNLNKQLIACFCIFYLFFFAFSCLFTNFFFFHFTYSNHRVLTALPLPLQCNH